jgi:hypothetical protein
MQTHHLVAKNGGFVRQCVWYDTRPTLPFRGDRQKYAYGMRNRGVLHSPFPAPVGLRSAKAFAPLKSQRDDEYCVISPLTGVI